MAKPPEIRTRAFVHVGDRLAEVETLTPAQRRTLAAALKARYLDELFRGRAAFLPEAEEKPPSDGQDAPND